MGLKSQMWARPVFSGSLCMSDMLIVSVCSLMFKEHYLFVCGQCV